MSATLLTYLFVALTFGVYIAIALWSRSDSTNEFYVAGGGVHPIANGAATAADWMSAAAFLHASELYCQVPAQLLDAHNVPVDVCIQQNHELQLLKVCQHEQKQP